MVAGWKEFAFFDATPVRDPSSEASPLYSDPELLEIVPGSGDTAFMSTRRGVVREFNASMQLISELTVCDPDSGRNLDFLRIVRDSRLLLTVASKLGSPLEVSVWDLNKNELHARALVVNGTNTFPTTAFAMAPDISVLVFGFADGSVIAVRGDLLHDKGTRQRLIYSSSTGITGLALTDSLDQVYVSSINQVLVVSTTASKSVSFLDKTKGADLGCTTKALNDEFLVARDSDLAWFNKIHRGPTIELPVTRKLIYLTQDGKYLVVLAVVESGNRSLLNTEALRLIIFDLKYHVIAFNSHLSNGIRAIFEKWDRLNVIGTNGMMYVINEKPLDARISLLTSRNLYQAAIQMAEESGTSQLKLTLHQDYADYLFERNDIEASLKEYITAIDFGQSSRAIQKFKDSQHADSLLRYLNALYERGMATPQHVTLQIICLSKLKKREELAEFLQSATKMEGFDFERAISVLTEVQDPKYAQLAAYVAEEWPDPDLVVQIRLRGIEDVQATLDYIQTVSVADALRILIQNSRLLLNKLPVETTGVLITLFTGKFVTRVPNFSDKVTKIVNNSKEYVSNAPVLQSYQAFINFLSSASYLGSHIVSAETIESQPDEPSYLPPRPRLIFPSFIGHSNEFVIFLEACLKAAPHFNPSEKDLSDIATTLFELYLEVGSAEKASELVDKYADHLQPVNVQTSSVYHNFKLEPRQLIALGSSLTDVFREAIESGDVESAIAIYYENAASSACTALQAVSQLSSNEVAVTKVRELSSQEFEKIFQAAISSGVSPVELITVLSKSDFITLGDVKPFLESYLGSLADQTSRHQKLAESYEAEIDEKKKAIANQAEKPMVFQYNNCRQCNLPLDLPAVHFACQHSYHQQCIGADAECPLCSPEHESIELLRSQNEETAAQEDYFMSELGKRQDKMKVVLDFISRGGLSKVH